MNYEPHKQFDSQEAQPQEATSEASRDLPTLNARERASMWSVHVGLGLLVLRLTQSMILYGWLLVSIAIILVPALIEETKSEKKTGKASDTEQQVVAKIRQFHEDYGWFDVVFSVVACVGCGLCCFVPWPLNAKPSIIIATVCDLSVMLCRFAVLMSEPKEKEEFAVIAVLMACLGGINFLILLGRHGNFLNLRTLRLLRVVLWVSIPILIFAFLGGDFLIAQENYKQINAPLIQATPLLVTGSTLVALTELGIVLWAVFYCRLLVRTRQAVRWSAYSH